VHPAFRLDRGALRAVLALCSLSSIVALLAAPAVGAAAPLARNVSLLAHVADHGIYSACTAYVHSDGREYAVIGTVTGTSILNITNPSVPYEVAFIPGFTSNWREMKSFQQWIYISTEAIGGGIQIVRMTDPEQPVLVGTYTGSFNRAHTLAVDPARALLIANGTRLNEFPAGMRILSLENPEQPVELSVYGLDYVQDSWVRSDTLYASCIQSGVQRLFDVAEPYVPLEITSWSYPNAATHSGETSRDGRWLYLCDERNYSTLKVFDMASPFLHELTEEVAVNPLAIVHNVHVKADTAFVAWYTEGVRLFDVADPSRPAEWGWYDTYGGFSGGFRGVWDVAMFPSGTFIASDITGGLFIFRADPDYGTIRVNVRDGSGQPIRGADVVRGGAEVAPGSSGGGDSTRTQARGFARLALAPGDHTLRITKFGTTPVSLPVTVTRGSRAAHDVTLLPAPSSPVGGAAVRLDDRLPVPGAVVAPPGAPWQGVTDAAGRYQVGAVPLGAYRATCLRAGYAPLARDIDVRAGEDRDDEWELLPAAWYDSCDTDRGWSTFTTGDHALEGQWERAVPYGTYSAPNAVGAVAGRSVARPAPRHEGGEVGVEVLAFGPVAPPFDATPGAGGFCFVTGNGPPGAGVGDHDVDGGQTTLTSPPLNLTSMEDPVVGFWRWYSMSTPGDPDSFLVEVSADGSTWVGVRSLRESDPAWRFDSFHVKDFITPSASVRVRFIAQDDGPGGIVEAAVDDVAVWDGTLVPSPLPPAPPAPSVAALDAPRPTPTRGAATITLRLSRAERARVVVFDLHGRRVATLWDGVAPAGALSLVWDGRDARGLRAASGVYWVRAEAAGADLLRKVVRAR
jgi:choice-of-anchor B domain-containing protein